MKKTIKKRNFIIFFLLAVLTISAAGSGLEHAGQVFFICNDKEKTTISSQSFVSCDQASAIRFSEELGSVTNLLNRRYSRSNFSYRNGLFFLCTLTFLSEVFKLDWEILHVFNPCHVKNACYNIAFMHDADGRKRIHN